jgi:3-oxo-5-alpha-steroid 4-dehydrogenase 1
MLEYILNDRIFVTYICPYTWIISSVFVVIFQGIVGIKASYGRYNNSNSGISGRLAWFIQECPCFIIPCYLLYQYWSSVTLTKFLLMAFFLIHYFQRVFIYPMLTRGGKHSSILIVLTAFIFCFLNAYSIAEEILAYHIYRKNEWLSFHFIFGLNYLFDK